jgi:hypothetical protein
MKMEQKTKRPVETVLRRGRRGIKENDGGSESNKYIL